MNRRAILRRTGALAAVGLAGCLSDGPGSSPTPIDSPTPAIDTTSIETTGTGCGSGDAGEASLEADASGHRLAVSGTLGTSNPCFLATLVETDLDDGTLSLTVGAERDGSEACVDCVGAIDYEATVQLTAGVEAAVVVSHESFEEVTEVHRETVQL